MKINILHNLLILLPMHDFKLQILNRGDLYPLNKPFQGMALADCPLSACLFTCFPSFFACLLACLLFSDRSSTNFIQEKFETCFLHLALSALSINTVLSSG